MSPSNAYGTLTEAQIDGRACLWCGREDGPMVPVMGGPTVPGTGPLFGHEACRPGRPAPTHVEDAERVVWKLEQLVRDHSITAGGRELARTALEQARRVYEQVQREAHGS